MSAEDTYFSLIEKVGSKSYYQGLVITVANIQWFIMGCILLSPSLLFLQSDPDCSSIILEPGQKCINYICSNIPESRWKEFFPSPIDSLRYSFGNIFICDKQWIVTLLQTIVYFGCFVSNVALGFLQDNYGRKITWIISGGFMTLGLAILGGSFNIIMSAAGLFVLGLGIDQTQNVTFVLMSETIGVEMLKYSNISVQLIFSVGGMFLGLIFVLLPHWRSIVLFTLLIPQAISFLLLYFIEETPRFILKKGTKQLYQSLGRIAKWNGMKQNPVQMVDIEIILEKSKKIAIQQNKKMLTMSDIFRYKSLRLSTICTACMLSCLTVVYYGPMLLIQNLSTGYFLNQILLNISEFINYFFVILIIDKVPRKKFGYLCFMLFGALNIIILFIHEPYAELAILCVARFIICSYFTMYVTFINELIPSAARGLSMSICVGVSRIFTLSTPQMVAFWIRKQLGATTLFAGFSVLGILSIMPVKETFGHKLQEQIAQLQQKLQNQDTRGSLLTDSSVKD